MKLNFEKLIETVFLLTTMGFGSFPDVHTCEGPSCNPTYAGDFLKKDHASQIF